MSREKNRKGLRQNGRKFTSNSLIAEKISIRKSNLPLQKAAQLN